MTEYKQGGIIYNFCFSIYDLNRKCVKCIDYEYHELDIPPVNNIINNVITEFVPPYADIFYFECSISVHKKDGILDRKEETKRLEKHCTFKCAYPLVKSLEIMYRWYCHQIFIKNPDAHKIYITTFAGDAPEMVWVDKTGETPQIILDNDQLEMFGWAEMPEITRKEFENV